MDLGYFGGQFSIADPRRWVSFKLPYVRIKRIWHIKTVRQHMANELSEFSLSALATNHIFYCVSQKGVTMINKSIFLTQIFFILQFIFPEHSFIL